MPGCLGVFVAAMILADVFEHEVWHGREWAEFGLGIGILLAGFIASMFDDRSSD